MVTEKASGLWGLFKVETTDDSKEMEMQLKRDQERTKLRELELQNEKEIALKREETLLEIERIRAQAKAANKETNPEVKKEKKEEIQKDWQEVKRMIEENNKMIVDSIGEKTSKLEEQQVQIAADLKNARERGDKRAEQIALKAMAEVNKKLGLVKGVGANLVTGKDIDELAQVTDKPWYQKIVWSSPKNWVLLVFFLGLIYLVYRIIMWGWGQVKSMILGDD
ncbi:MAG: hypothetical protein MRERV_13c013 [Mycoplasmataceae bacterium RV_VA103A]|nr:MAG: hypothetical protein MRERV_13c013 [Mycoplasmataceae bacterium RV_VA103A]